jgi:hypothetical protein
MFYSVKDLGTRDSIIDILKDMRDQLEIYQNMRILSRDVNKLVQLAKCGLPGWELVQPAIVSEKVSGSPFEFPNLIRHASTLAFAAGQNLWSFTKGPNSASIKSCVFSFLKKKGASVQVLVQDPDFREGCIAWESIMKGFTDDLCNSIKEFVVWLRNAEKSGINSKRRRRLDIRLASFVPLSFDVFDPNSSSGMMVIRPVLPRAPQSPLRPAIFLSGGRGNKIFDYYWQIVSTAFKEARTLQFSNS